MEILNRKLMQRRKKLITILREQSSYSYLLALVVTHENKLSTLSWQEIKIMEDTYNGCQDISLAAILNPTSSTHYYFNPCNLTKVTNFFKISSLT